MNDYIKREAAVKITWQEPTYSDALNVLTEVRERINDIPSADVVEVVRCRECKHCEEYESMAGIEHYCNRTWCSLYDWSDTPCFYVKPDGYCSYGERKDHDSV